MTGSLLGRNCSAGSRCDRWSNRRSHSPSGNRTCATQERRVSQEKGSGTAQEGIERAGQERCQVAWNRGIIDATPQVSLKGFQQAVSPISEPGLPSYVLTPCLCPPALPTFSLTPGVSNAYANRTSISGHDLRCRSSARDAAAIRPKHQGLGNWKSETAEVIRPPVFSAGALMGGDRRPRILYIRFCGMTRRLSNGSKGWPGASRHPC